MSPMKIPTKVPESIDQMRRSNGMQFTFFFGLPMDPSQQDRNGDHPANGIGSLGSLVKV